LRWYDREKEKEKEMKEKEEGAPIRPFHSAPCSQLGMTRKEYICIDFILGHPIIIAIYSPKPKI